MRKYRLFAFGLWAKCRNRPLWYWGEGVEVKKCNASQQLANVATEGDVVSEKQGKRTKKATFFGKKHRFSTATPVVFLWVKGSFPHLFMWKMCRTPE